MKKGQKPLRDELDAALARNRKQIERILDEYGVPRVAGGGGDPGGRGNSGGFEARAAAAR